MFLGVDFKIGSIFCIYEKFRGHTIFKGGWLLLWKC